MEDWKLQPAHDIGLPLTDRLRSVNREAGLIDSMTHLAWWSVLKLYFKAFHRLSIEGRQNLPAGGPMVLAANHSSHLDALVLVSAISWRLRDQVFPVAAGDKFFSTRLASVVSASLFNALPIWRRRAGPHALSELRDRLIADHCVYILFPEGTRTRTGDMAPFKAGLGMLVAGTDIPVLPCRLWGTFKAFPPRRHWPRPNKVRLSIGRPITFAETTNDRDGWIAISAAVQSAVSAL